jgi:hypothetical protein
MDVRTNPKDAEFKHAMVYLVMEIFITNTF